MSPPTYQDQVLAAIKEIKDDLKEFIRAHDDRERNLIKENAERDAKITSLERLHGRVRLIETRVWMTMGGFTAAMIAFEVWKALRK